MIALLSALTGSLIALMLAANGQLTLSAGAYSATAIIHAVGLAPTALMLIGRRREKSARPAPVFYLGGLVGVATTVLNNLAYGRISMTALLALSLLGQSLTSIFIDQFGLLGMEKRPFTRGKLLGLLLTIAGIGVLAWPFQAVQALPMALSLLSGCTIVIARTLNAGLALGRGLRFSAFINYLTGLIGSLAMLYLAGRGEPMLLGAALPGYWWLYAGGLMGVAVTLLSNYTVSRISAFSLTLLLFVSQVGTGAVLDCFTQGALAPATLLAAALAATGLVVMNR